MNKTNKHGNLFSFCFFKFRLNEALLILSSTYYEFHMLLNEAEC